MKENCQEEFRVKGRAGMPCKGCESGTGAGTAFKMSSFTHDSLIDCGCKHHCTQSIFEMQGSRDVC